MKNKSITFLMFLPFLFSSCNNPDPDYYEMVDYNSVTYFNKKEIMDYFDYSGLEFFIYKGYDYTIEHPYEDKPRLVQKSTHKAVTEEAFKKVRNNMTLFEVVRIVGIPCDSFTFGIESLAFKISDDKYEVIFIAHNSDGLHIVTGVD